MYRKECALIDHICSALKDLLKSGCFPDSGSCDTSGLSGVVGLEWLIIMANWCRSACLAGFWDLARCSRWSCKIVLNIL